MANGKRYSRDKKYIFPTSSTALRGRQSTRATFKLSEKAIESISIVASHLGIKQKSLFDHLIDDIKLLNRVAKEIQADEFNELKRIQKTYVMSKKTISYLEEASRNYNTPRDALVEYSIKRLMPVIEEEQQRHKKRKLIFDEVKKYLLHGEKILDNIRELVGEDDPLFEEFELATNTLNNVYESIESYIEKGQRIEEL